MNAHTNGKVEGTIPSTFDIPVMNEPPHLPRQFIYRFFASLFLYPEPERLATVQAVAAEMMEAGLMNEELPYTEFLTTLFDRLAALDLEEERRAIVNEYNRLFLIRPKAPPHETYYTDAEGQFRGLMTSNLEEEYRQAGVGIASGLNELPDHISVELEFMSFLGGEEMKAREENRFLDETRFQASQKAFMGAHLARWFPKLARRVREAAPEHLYHLVLQAAYAFLLHELHYLDIQP